MTDPVNIPREAVRIKHDIVDALAPHNAMSVLLNFILGAANGPKRWSPAQSSTWPRSCLNDPPVPRRGRR